jgi:hypothetical protein
MRELQRIEDYFPYIGHNLDFSNPKKGSLWMPIIGPLFESGNLTPDLDRLDLTSTIIGSRGIFSRATLLGMKAQQAIAADPNAVEAVIPRHRTLYDYCIHMPAHSHFINKEVMLLAGHNLFIHKYSELLRDYGGIVFLRHDAEIKRKGYPKVFLSQHQYIKEILPAYLKQEMIDGVGEKHIRRDFILYPGQEKDPVTHVRAGGRSKSGRLRKLNPIFFEKFSKITKGSQTRFFVTPVCISFSKYPDAPYLVHSTSYQGILKALRYLHEQNFIYNGYIAYAEKHPEAKLEVIVNYGNPKPFKGEDYNSMRDLFEFVNELRDDIGRLECIFPLTLLFQSMEGEADVSVEQLNLRAQKYYDHYQKLGINVEKISERPGKMMNIIEMIDVSLATINSNPSFHVYGLKTDHFLSFRTGRVYSHDEKLQTWYTNLVEHLSPNAQAAAD